MLSTLTSCLLPGNAVGQPPAARLLSSAGERYALDISVSEFGSCPCGGEFESRLVEVRMQVEGESVVLEDVHQGVCPNCGSRVYKAGTLDEIESLLNHRPLDRAARLG